MTSHPLRVLAAVPAHDEEMKIGSVLSRFLPGTVHETLLVDDGSTDRTGEVARSHGATVIRHSQRRGVGAALRTAVEYARAKGHDVLVVLAANDKDRADEIPRLLEAIEKEGCDFVQGSRYLPGGAYGKMPFYRLIATRWIHPLLFSLAVGRRVTDSTNGFRAFRLSLLQDPRINLGQDWLDHYEMEPYLYFKAVILGYKVKEVPVTKIYPPKELGYTKMTPLISWWSILRPIILLGLRIRN